MAVSKPTAVSDRALLVGDECADPVRRWPMKRRSQQMEHFFLSVINIVINVHQRPEDVSLFFAAAGAPFAAAGTSFI